jgi:hypothetical protein
LVAKTILETIGEARCRRGGGYRADDIATAQSGPNKRSDARDVAAVKRGIRYHGDEMKGLQKPLFFRPQMLFLKILREPRMTARRARARSETGSRDVS